MLRQALNPLDGRYFEKTRALAEYFSEEALMKYRTQVECEFFIFLASSRAVGLRKISTQEIKRVRSLYVDFSDKSFSSIKKYEKTTNHDVKSVEYFIKDSLKNTSLKNTLEWVHFGLTSEDVNNLAYALMLSLSLKNTLVPKITEINKNLENLARKYKGLPMLSRTHGQSASPTTLGKEFKVFSVRLKRQLKTLREYKIQAKLNGATGNYNALHVAYPKTDWISFSKKFITHLGKTADVSLETNLLTTQIEPHDTYAELSDNLRRINTILLDFNQDIWRYISDGWITQKPKEGEVGSSTMPHKINPIDFENAEGNLGLANTLLSFFATKLPISRLQRDLSDSTVERSWGVALGYSLLAYLSILRGMSKIEANKEKITADLWNNPEVIAEGIQTILRRENYPVPYEALKKLTRGKSVSMEDFARFIDSLEISPKVKGELKKITPGNYTGLAEKLAVL